MSAILNALVPVTLVIVLGLVLRRTLLRETSYWFGLEQLTYFVLFPALLTVSAIKADLSKVSFAGVVGAYALMLLLLGAAVLALRPVLQRRMGVDGPAFTSLFQGVVRWNTYLSLAIADGLFGAEGVAVAAVTLVCLIPMVNVMVVGVLARHASATPRMSGIVQQLVRNPLIWSCAAGMAINLSGLPVPAAAIEFGEVLGAASLATGLLVVGAGLSLRDLVRPRPVTFLATGLQLLVKPAATFAIGFAFGLRGMELTVITLLAAVPSAPTGYVLARQMGGDAPLLAEILSVQIVAAAVTLPLVAITATALGA
ncbi:AEC family transporter [Aquabacter spiritensis]|uniref:AEC family transporter n=1 Tax=Aquabacter spiritensis TaxID=933073 RepID=A0A4R3LR34_9HYPH|nr:AEC family transporter [Aquabacter spiritensis]TCT02860.1 hypothetical protein EDC64_11132 [Aquabacter spiritensis]